MSQNAKEISEEYYSFASEYQENTDGKPSQSKIITKAQELLQIPPEKVPIPKDFLDSWVGQQKLTSNYLKMRRIILEALAKGRCIDFSLDGDGNLFTKTVAKTQNTDGTGSLSDKLALRLVLWVNHQLGGSYEVNTQRIGILASPSILGSEGEDIAVPLEQLADEYVSKKQSITKEEALKQIKTTYKTDEQFAFLPSFRNISNISQIHREYGIYSLKDPLYYALVVKGLGSSIIHRPKQKLKIHSKAIIFSEILDFINSNFDFLDKFYEIIKDQGLRILEFKSLPTYLTSTHGESKLGDYLTLIELVEHAIEQGLSDGQLAKQICSLKLPMNSKFNTLIEQLEDPKNERVITKTFINSLRFGKIFCLVPHTINSYNILDEDSKIKLAELIVNTIRTPEVRLFFLKKYGISQNEEIININGRNISHIAFKEGHLVNTITNYTYKNFNELVHDLKKVRTQAYIDEKISPPLNKVTNRQYKNQEEFDADMAASVAAPEHSIIKIIANAPNPYFELTANTDKQDDLSDIHEIRNQERFLVGGEDSPSGTGLLAHALLANKVDFNNHQVIDNFGAAFIARGQIEIKIHLIPKIIEFLQQEKYSSHELALEKTKTKTNYSYRFINQPSSSEISIDDVITILENIFQPLIVKQPTVSLNVSAMGSIFLELAQALNLSGLREIVGLKNPSQFNLEVDEEIYWVKEFLEKRNKGSLSTPLILGLSELIEQEAKEKGGYKKPLSEQSQFSRILANIPLGIGRLISLEKSGEAFQKAFIFISTVLIGGGILGIVSIILNSAYLSHLSISIQKTGYIAQTVIVGISFYLMSHHKFPLKSIGELMGFISTLFSKGSPEEEIFRALSEVNLAGIGEQELILSNMDIDKPKDKDEYGLFFKNKEFIHPRNITTPLTQYRSELIYQFKYKFWNGILLKFGFLGDFVARIIPSLLVMAILTKQFLTEPGLRKGIFSNLLPTIQDGVSSRIGKNNGIEYKTPHSQPHILSSTAMATIIISLVALILERLSPFTAGFLISLANVLPSLALINRAKKLQFNISGVPTKFTDFHGNEQTFNPQQAAKWQLIGSYLMTLGGLGRGLYGDGILQVLHLLSGFIQNMGLGFLVLGLSREFKNQLDDAEVFQLIHQGRSFEDLVYNFTTLEERELILSVASTKSTDL